jgi:hypothetical protein
MQKWLSTRIGEKGEDDAYTLQIEAEVVVVVERSRSGREILKFCCGNLVYECAKCLLETGGHVV